VELRHPDAQETRFSNSIRDCSLHLNHERNHNIVLPNEGSYRDECSQKGTVREFHEVIHSVRRSLHSSLQCDHVVVERSDQKIIRSV
jgi:hypothetical protein